MGAIAYQITSLAIVGSKKTSKHRVTGLCAGNSPVTGEFPAQMVSNGRAFGPNKSHHHGRYIKGRFILKIPPYQYMTLEYLDLFFIMGIPVLGNMFF